MNKEFVPYELALRLKKLGFDEPCLAVFELIAVGDIIPKFRYNWDSEDKWFDHNKDKSEYEDHDWYWSAPTFSQAFRWFREKYDLRIWIESNYGVAKFEYVIATTNPDCIDKQFNDLSAYKTYEEAELACLDKLIEIVESKKKEDEIN